MTQAAANSAQGVQARPGTTTEIAPPLLLDDAAQLDWSDSADVVVVGWGAAGACAAIEARDGGASVIVIDRFEGGGASALSGGVVYAGGGTRQQREAGFDDTPQAMFDYLRHEVGDAVREDTLMRFCRNSVSNLEWLESLGLRYDATMPEKKTSYPPQHAFLYYSGNETVPAMRGTHAPAPRGHRTVARGQAGATLYAGLRKATLEYGARAVTQATVRRLVQDRITGRVLGVEVWELPAGDARQERHAALNRQANKWRNYRSAKAEAWRREAAAIERECARPRFIRAHGGVVLSAGGFVFNREMIKTHAPRYARGWKNGHAGCDGSGIRLGASVGGETDRLSSVSAWRFITPPYSWPGSIVVNSDGARFCNEEVYGATLGHAMVEGQGGKAWMILDSRLRRQSLKECLFGKLWAFQALPAIGAMLFGAHKASTVAELAKRISADADTLQHNLDAYNAAAHGRAPDLFGKSAETCRPLETAPYYAIDISIGAALFPLATITLGGLKVNEDNGHVLASDGADIPGLFAAGRTAIGIPSSAYISGSSLADCVFSGRRAGAAAAAESTGAAVARTVPDESRETI
ncbi:3-oxo-5alpha-steroid 4-dehydrogenase [Collimonas sp. OK607]|uniref:FAD-binding protein n=1 Tax=Collimonas sp. OK607 TaxID=1798194 RepID=UPI0008E6E280|nr:FAD-binding protein [Collimonas sp. OK607]SFA82437.1 3-oxo-5alpha-steroid 4-dehydrogenase [Collimonas sp. OK607]